jgi:hypothetical protein
MEKDRVCCFCLVSNSKHPRGRACRPPARSPLCVEHWSDTVFTVQSFYRAAKTGENCVKCRAQPCAAAAEGRS